MVAVSTDFEKSTKKTHQLGFLKPGTVGVKWRNDWLWGNNRIPATSSYKNKNDTKEFKARKRCQATQSIILHGRTTILWLPENGIMKESFMIRYFIMNRWERSNVWTTNVKLTLSEKIVRTWFPLLEEVHVLVQLCVTSNLWWEKGESKSQGG